MIKITLPPPPWDEQLLVKKGIELADHYLTQERWASHQCVFKSLLEIFQVPYPPEALRILSGFSAGGGFSGENCGALQGGLAALGYIYGSGEPIPEQAFQRFLNAILTEDLSPSAKAMELLESFSPRHFIFNKMVTNFKEEFGHITCRGLMAPFRANPISKRRFGTCRRIVRNTAGLTVQLILDLEKGDIEPIMGENLYSYLWE